LYARHGEEAALLERQVDEVRAEATDRLRTVGVDGSPSSLFDVLRLNVGGDSSFATTRKTLTCLGHSRLAELFSGRWDSALPRDEAGRIFLDFDPVQFRALLDWLGDVCRTGPSAEIPNPEESMATNDRWGFGALCSLLRLMPPPSSSASVLANTEVEAQTPLVSLAEPVVESATVPDGSLLTPTSAAQLHRMLGNAPGCKKFVLLHRASTDGFTAAAFHAHCDGVARTVTVARSVGGFIFGGYSGSAAWGNQGQWAASDGAFLFRLDGPGVSAPSKHALVQNPGHAIYCHGGHGPTFGAGHDLYIQNSAGIGGATNVTATSNLGASYSQVSEGGEAGITTLAESSSVTVVEWEVFSVEVQPSVENLLKEALSVPGETPECQALLSKVRDLLTVARADQHLLKRRRNELATRRAHLEHDIEFMTKFINTPGSEHQIVHLNISGKTMATVRSTLTQCAGSLLASKFGPRWCLQDEDVVDGGVFFDLSPALFGTVLQFLRLKRLCGDDLDSKDLSAPPVPLISVSAFDRLLDYLSMKEYVPLAVLDSVLLAHEQIATVRVWLSTNNRELNRAQLLHRASRDGFTASSFHNHCDGHSHSLVVARSAAGFLFGAYSGSATWGSTGAYTASEDAFVFRLSGPGVATPSKHPLVQNPWTMYCHMGYGPTFGGGHDLCIQNAAGTNGTATSSMGHTYSQQAEGGAVTVTTLAESNSFPVTDYEVFALAPISSTLTDITDTIPT